MGQPAANVWKMYTAKWVYMIKNNIKSANLSDNIFVEKLKAGLRKKALKNEELKKELKKMGIYNQVMKPEK